MVVNDGARTFIANGRQDGEDVASLELHFLLEMLEAIAH